VEVSEIIEQQIIDDFKSEIKEASGQEIFLIGKINPESSLIEDYEILARGNDHSVPAVLSDINPGNIIIHNHPSGNLTPSGADINIASGMGDKGIGFAIINNSVDNIYIVVEPKIPDKEKLIDEQQVISLFKDDGNLAKRLNNFEYREQQIAVLKKTIDSFNFKKNYFIEAGTGTGKSFAYLIPALFWAHQNNQPVVVSTNTINLQEQIAKKDLLFLKKIMPFNFKSVLVKGRSNYLCLRKKSYTNNRLENTFVKEPDKKRELIKVLDWAEETKNGTKSDIKFSIKSDVWEKVASESDLCLKTNCPNFNSCFFMEARKEIFSADILIVNHHLLLSDANLKKESRGLLPDYQHLVIDEAHNLHKVATHHLGYPVNYNLIMKYLERLDDSQFSLITRINNILSGKDIKNKGKLFDIIDNKILSQVIRVKENTEDYFNELEKLLKNNNKKMLRLTDKITETPAWEQIRETGQKLMKYLNNLCFYQKKLYKKLNTIFTDNDKLEELLIELKSNINSYQEIINTLRFNLQTEDENYVFWLERNFKNNKISQKNAPLDIAGILPDILWNKLANVILTSATLTVNDKFDFFKNSLGLNNSNELRVNSPFDYSSQAKLLIPVDIPSANSSSFLKEIIDDFKEMLISFGGATLVLFTSYSMLNYCLNYCEQEIKDQGIDILPQGKYPRHYIINQFKKNNTQIIFGTVSFWEGVDIKGDDLKYLIIMKLPFPVPSRPVAAARREQLKKQGKNPFMNFSLPQAVIRFKQGFGRLIRSKNDQGIVINFDNRIIEKTYGKIFLKSLPENCPVKKIKIDELKKEFIS